ncbi:DUF3854 domain-containing protein [Vallitalea guaymasensis]|uniref:DUF3854 domain-containing protein n=1 Tax=Vallitalea guaymasensis TaxID=1185412 RepID=UPI000DE573AE|nr:DUF3854 domain-containing protein [Vallitalea guaymasensis]
MAHNMISVTRSNPCPICGKPDWCGWLPIEEGRLLICMRDTLCSNQQGLDGNFYVFHGHSKTGNNSTYEEATQRFNRCGDDSDKTYQKANYVREIIVQEDEVPLSPPERLDSIYKELLNQLILEDYHKKTLMDDGWTEELIKESGVKSFPVPDFIRYKNKIRTRNPKRKELAASLYNKFGDLTGVPGLYINEFKGSKYWTIAGASGMIFPLQNLHKQVIRLRIRMDEEFNGKYRYLSSYKLIEVNNQRINKYTNGTRALNTITFNTSDCISKSDYYVTYITEGCKKAIVGNKKLKAPFGNVPGVNSFGKLLDKDHTGKRVIDILRERGTKIIIIAYDADKNSNTAVMKHFKNTINVIKKEGFSIGVAEWPEYFGKGLDDILLKGITPIYTIPDFEN